RIWANGAPSWIASVPVSPNAGPCCPRPAASTSAWARRAVSTEPRRSDARWRYRNEPAPASRAAIASANARVSLSRMGSRIWSRVPEPVPGAPDGLDRLQAERPVHLLPQVLHVDVDDVRPALVRPVPHVFDQAHPRQDLTGVAHEELQEGELLRRQLDGRASPMDRPGGGVERDVADDQDGRALP